MNDSRFEVRELYRKPFNFSPFHDTSLLTDNGLYACRVGDILMRLNVATGDVLWEARLPAGQRSAARRSEGRGSGVSVTYADGRIYARHTFGRVTLIEPSPDGLHERGSFDIPDHVASMGVTNPVIAGGRLFLRDDNRLFCYDVREGGLPAPPPPAKVTVLRIPQALSRSPTKDGETVRRSGPRSVFVPTPYDIVDKMLELARVKPTDLVYDLGSGDGRVPMAAATKYGCRAIGVEIDTELVNLSRAHIKKQGLDHLVTIEEKDVFTVYLGQADVVVLYLLPNQLEKLLPQLKKLKPGSRVVSHQFEIPNLADQRTVSLQSNEDDAAHTVYLWTAPGGE
jgi:precorrin-6B methylase 2